MTHRICTILIFTAAAAIVSSGCSDNPQSCATTDDCFGGEACIAGVCQASTANNGNGNNGAGNNGTSHDDAGNNDAFDDDAGNNGTPGDAGTEDTGQDTSGRVTCAVDPFTASCDNDDDYDNEEWIDGDPMKDGSLGCYGGLERPEDWTKTIEGKMCFDEGGDFFRLQMVPCESQFRLAVKLTVPPMCTETQFGLEARVGGGIIECDEERDYMSAQCSRDGNTFTWTILAKPANSIWSMYFGVLGAESEDVASQFDYTLEARIF